MGLLGTGWVQAREDYSGAVKVRTTLNEEWDRFRAVFLEQQSLAFQGELASLQGVKALEHHWHTADWRALEEAICTQGAEKRVRDPSPY